MSTHPHHELLEKLNIDFLDDECVWFVALEMIDDHHASSVISSELDSHVAVLHFGNHPRVNEAAREEIVARRPVDEFVFVRLDFDRIEQLSHWVVVARECPNSPLIEIHSITGINARFPRENVSWATRLGEHNISRLWITPEVEFTAFRDISNAEMISSHDVESFDLRHNVWKEFVEQGNIRERSDGENCYIARILLNQILHCQYCVFLFDQVIAWLVGVDHSKTVDSVERLVVPLDLN